MLVIVQFVLSLLITFNVVNTCTTISSLRSGTLSMPCSIRSSARSGGSCPIPGSIDFSPMVLIIVLTYLQIILIQNLRTALTA